MKKLPLLLALLALLWTACRDRTEPEVSPCGYCPNNTVCMDDACGCPPDKIDMGSWCMRRQDNLFIARDMLGCPCFEPFGLVLANINPEQPGTVISTSLYGIEARETYNAGMQANFAYYKRPGGDSISIWSMAIPKAFFPSYCEISAEQRCMPHLGGRFVGPDSIRATITWTLCSDPDNIPEPYHFWLVREP